MSWSRHLNDSWPASVNAFRKDIMDIGNSSLAINSNFETPVPDINFLPFFFSVIFYLIPKTPRENNNKLNSPANHTRPLSTIAAVARPMSFALPACRTNKRIGGMATAADPGFARRLRLSFSLRRTGLGLRARRGSEPTTGAALALLLDESSLKGRGDARSSSLRDCK